MKVTLNELVAAGSVGQNVGSTIGALGRFGELPLQIADSYRFDCIAEKVDVYLKVYAQKRLELYKKHGEHDTENNAYRLTTQKQIDAFNAEMEDLLRLEIDLLEQPFLLATLEDFRLSRNDLRLLRWLIDDGHVSKAETADAAAA